jgi:hypothetical protein
MIERQRKCNHSALRQQQGQDAPEVNVQRPQVHADEAPLLALLVGDIERVDHCSGERESVGGLIRSPEMPCVLREDCRRRAAAKPTIAAAMTSPICMFRPFRPPRGRTAGRRGGAGDAINTSAAVLFAASVSSRLSGLALIATRSRLESEGNSRGWRFSRPTATAAQIADITRSSAPMAPNAWNSP